VSVESEDWDSAVPVQSISVPVSINGTYDPEEYVIACCFMDQGESLDKTLQAGLSSVDFRDRNLGSIYNQLRHMRREKAPIDLSTAVSWFGPEGVESVGGISRLLSLDDPIRFSTTSYLHKYLGRILQDSANRREIAKAKTLLERAERGEDIATLPPKSEARDLDSKRVRLAAKPAEPVTRLFLAGKPIATPGNLVTLISRAKTGKTAAIGAAVAAIIAAHHDRPNQDTFGFTAPHTREAVVLIDTEQSPYDAFTCHERALARAGETNDPDWLCHYALVGETAAQMVEDLPKILAKAKATHGGVFTIILDGVADFVASVNDEAECNNFIAWLRKLAVEYDCPIICVIHSNEAVKSGDDGRGHLGKQLTRKAESNLLLKKEGEITTITSEKQRKAPITEKDGVAFRWSDQLGRHVSCKPSSDEKAGKAGRTPSYHFPDFQSIFKADPKLALTRQASFKFAQDRSDISEASWRRLLNDTVQAGGLIAVEKPTGYYYHLPVI